MNYSWKQAQYLCYFYVRVKQKISYIFYTRACIIININECLRILIVYIFYILIKKETP
jgi:hypothetical protein